MVTSVAAFFKRFYSTLQSKELRKVLPSYLKPVESTEVTKKMIRVALVGFTNAGKSTLINSILGLHLCAASKRPLTTKDYQKVTFVKGDTKVIFVDTPGILSRQLKKLSPFTPSEKIIQEKVRRNTDLIGLIVDSSSRYSKFKIRDHLKLLTSFFPEKAEIILIFNKIDILKDKSELLLLAKKYYNTGKSLEPETTDDQMKSIKRFSQVFMISALKNDGVEFLVNYFISKAYQIPESITLQRVTSHRDERVIEDRIRASLLEYIKQEIPYSCKCQLEYMSEDDNGKLIIVVTILCPSKRVFYTVENQKLQELIIKDCTLDFHQIFNKAISLKLVPILEKNTKSHTKQ